MKKYKIENGKAIELPEDFDDSKIKFDLPKQAIFTTRKDIIKLLAEDIWDKCPKCGCETVYIKIQHGEIASKIEIICYDCQYTKDASHYELW